MPSWRPRQTPLIGALLTRLHLLDWLLTRANSPKPPHTAGAVPAVPRVHGGAAPVPAAPERLFQAQPAARPWGASAVAVFLGFLPQHLCRLVVSAAVIRWCRHSVV